MNNYKNLIIWQKSIKLVTYIYKITKKLPREELYNLTSQIRRSAISIPSNIAEWHGRNWRKEYKQFLGIARWSAMELETQLIIAKELKYINDNEFNEINKSIVEILKILSSIINKL